MTDETTSEASSRSQDRRLELTLRRVAGVAERPAGCHRCAVTVGDALNLGCPHDGHERAGESPINVKLLDATLKRIEASSKLLSDGEGTWRVVPAGAGAPEGPLWNQWTWRALVAADDDTWSVTGNDVETLERCKTSLCFAGWADELDALPGERIWLVDADETAKLDHDDWRYVMALELSSLLLARPDDEVTVHLSTFDPTAENDDRRVVNASDRARRLLGLDRAIKLYHEIVSGMDAFERFAADVPYPEIVEHLFSSTSTLDDLRDLATDLKEMNDWLITHAPASAPGDFVTGPADERPPARPREEG